MPTWAWILAGVGAGALGVVLLIVLVLKFVLPKIIRKGVGAMFSAKAAALRGAELLVGSIASVEGPPREAFIEEEDYRSVLAEERSGGRWVRIEATVTPKPSAGEGGFTHWEPDELSLVPTPANGKLDLETLSGDSDLDCYVVRPGDQRLGDTDEELEEMKIQGPCQVVLTAYVPAEHRTVSMHYYTELVGQPITLP